MPATSDHRLPRQVLPRHYSLELAPDLDAATFGGRASVDVEVVEATREIVLNAAELRIDTACLRVGDTSVDLGCSLDPHLERLTLHSPQLIEPGPAVIDLTFEGVLNDKLRGFYRSTFVDDTGETHTIATTQFESTNARRAFPCWDEPDLKATFDVVLTVPADLLAISSGREVSRQPVPGDLHRVEFGTTMLMSTYLLAFVVGPLEATEPIDVDGVPLRIVHPPGKGHLTAFAAEMGAFSLRHFHEYFAIPYPGDKLDLVGLPDFAFGAMENLGCVTFREALLLLDEAETTQPEQQRVADVIAHEIAHMWFGDLVTMAWWDGIWLKEAFATFCEMHATDAFRPSWRRWDDFGLSRTAAFDVDSLTTTRPIEFEVSSPEDAEAMYDTLTYEKGAAVVRMLEQYLGADRFREGIRHYLAKHAYGNTETLDLWDAIEGATGEPVRRIMSSWIQQGGYPLVGIEKVSPTALRLTQQRFSFMPTNDAQEWVVPLVLAAGGPDGRRRHPVLLEGTSIDIDLGAPSPSWVAGNADANGFYRVRLDGELQPATMGSLTQLHAVERYGLVDDAWASVVAGDQTVGHVLDVLRSVAPGEDDVAVWRRMLAIIREIDRHLLGESKARHREEFTAVIGAALEPLGREPSENEPEQVGELRAALFETGGLLADPDQVAAAREIIGTTADPARSAAAVRVVAANGDADDFAEFVRRYEAATSPQEERRYLFALPIFRGETEIAAVLDLLDTDRVRSQDGGFVLGHLLAQSGAASRTWGYIELNWERIGRRYPDNSLPRMMDGAAAVADPAVADAIAAFFETHELPQAGQRLFQQLERMRVNVALRARLREQLG